VVGIVTAKQAEQDILVISENGFGKRSALEDYRITNRGGKGVKTINITDKTGDLIAIKAVTDEDDLMIITQNGIAIRLAVRGVRVMGRNTQGVRLINLRDGDQIAAATQVPANGEDEDHGGGGTEDVADQ
jgi:DNA gyrase subunit A